VDINQPIFLGLDLAALLALPAMLAMFLFAVWWGLSRADVGIDEDEQARRIEASGRS
jgi:hypothetical protein